MRRAVVTLAYDLETTGLSATCDRAVQIAAKIFRVGVDGRSHGIGDKGTFVSLINPGSRRVHPEAAKTTGITDRKVQSAASFPYVWKQLMEVIRGVLPDGVREGDATLRLVGHNSRAYDDIMIAAEHRRFDFVLPKPFGDFAVECADTMVASRALAKADPASFRGNHRLGTLYAAVAGKPLEGAHDALVDAAAVERIANHPPISAHLAFEPWSARVAAYEARVAKAAAAGGDTKKKPPKPPAQPPPPPPPPTPALAFPPQRPTTPRPQRQQQQQPPKSPMRLSSGAEEAAAETRCKRPASSQPATRRRRCLAVACPSCLVVFSPFFRHSCGARDARSGAAAYPGYGRWQTGDATGRKCPGSSSATPQV